MILVHLFIKWGISTLPFTVNHSSPWRGSLFKKCKKHWLENIDKTGGIMASGAKDGEGKVKQVKESDNKILFFFSNTKVCLWESGKYIPSTFLKIRTLYVCSLTAIALMGNLMACSVVPVKWNSVRKRWVGEGTAGFMSPCLRWLRLSRLEPGLGWGKDSEHNSFGSTLQYL